VAVNIEICMGSSCFSRGNERNLGVVKAFLDEHGLTVDVKLRGCLCLDACSCGPHITVDGTRYDRVDPNLCLDILRKHIAKE
jgi:NADH:ubiquinone oxidoreductase subunit E